jgi:SOS response regulatory protein OraA/RecX
MATKKTPVNENLTKAFESVKPANPALSSADKTYLRGLRRRGFTQIEIQEVAKNAGFQVPSDLFEPKKKVAPKA